MNIKKEFLFSPCALNEGEARRSTKKKKKSLNGSVGDVIDKDAKLSCNKRKQRAYCSLI